jgi:hypothetical protein
MIGIAMAAILVAIVVVVPIVGLVLGGGIEHLFGP